jgi:hypothetical protein
MEAALDAGDFYKTYLASALIKLQDGDKKDADWVFSMQGTPLTLLLEAVSLSNVMEKVVQLVLDRSQKVTVEYYEVFVDYWTSFVRQVLLNERNTHLESLHPRLLTCLRDLDLKQRGFLPRVRGRLSWVRKSLGVMSFTAALSVHEAHTK